MKILLIDDDTELVLMLTDYLSREGFDVTAVGDGKIGATEAVSGKYLLAILDIMMPRLNGLEALRRIRLTSQVPILMLTAKGDDADRISGLELGADDYVPKPCTPRELTARIRAILRRTHASNSIPATSSPLATGLLTLWPERRYVEWEGNPVAVTSTEYNLLEVLVRATGQPVSKMELSERALGRPLARFDRNIDVHLSSLRRKLGSLEGGRSCIQTVFRQGYQFVER